MTTHAAPFNIKRHGTETTVVSFDASGSASFAQGMDFGGAVRTTGVLAGNTIDVSASAHFKGRIQAGEGGTLSEVLCLKRVALPANNTKVTAEVPEGSDIIGVMAFVQNPPSSSALSTTNILVGTSAHDNRFLQVTNATAQGYYTAITSTRTSGWMAVSGVNARIMVHTTATSGAIASGASGYIGITYIRRQ